MNTGVVSTGLVPLTIGSVEKFQDKPLLNELPWDLTGGSASLILSNPAGAQTTIAATIVPGGYGATANWTVIAPAGNWLRAWSLTDASGRHQVTLPIPFVVIASPS
jgi:hypothetical protein